MSTFGVYYLSLYFLITLNFVGCSKWVDDLAKYVAETSEFNQVAFITRRSEETSIENPLIEELLIKLMGNVLIVRVNFGRDFELPANLESGNAKEGKTLIDKSPTFFIIVIESRDSLPTPLAKRFIDAVADMSAFQFSPKYLFISVAEHRSENVRGLLEYAWTKKMLDFTGLEIVEPPRSTTILRPVYSLIIHQLNPFKKEYTYRHWTAGETDFFPDKSNNLWGYPLIIGVSYLPLISDFTINPSLRLLNELVQHLNCSVKYVLLRSLVYDVNSDILHSEMQSNDVDLVPSLISYVEGSETKLQLTRVIRTDGIYFVVPVLMRSELRVSTNFFAGFLLTSCIVFIFWITMRLLRVVSYPWEVVVIVNLIFGWSVNRQPRRNVDRIVFTCLLAICAFYSSTLYTAITDFTLETTSEIEFETFDDLANSELIFQGHSSYLEHASDTFGGPSMVSENRFVVKNDPLGCVQDLNESKSVACLMEKSTALVSMMTYNPRGPRSMKLAQPRLLTENYGFPIGRRSPYRATIDKLILRFHTWGLIDIWYYEFDRYLENLRSTLDEGKADEENSLEIRLIIVAVVGYSLSFIVLLGEIIFYRISLYIKSNRRPPPPPRPPLRPLRRPLPFRPAPVPFIN